MTTPEESISRLDTIVARTGAALERLDRLEYRLKTTFEYLVRLEESIDRLRAERPTYIYIPPPTCPFPHHPPPFQATPYITWSMTFPPKPEDGAK